MAKFWDIFDRFLAVVTAVCTVVGTYKVLYPGTSVTTAPQGGEPMLALTAPWWAYALILVGVTGLCVSAVRAIMSRRTNKPVSVTEGAQQPLPQTINPLETYFSKKIIRIADLIFDANYTISDKTFEDCIIYGPALVGLLDHTMMADSKFTGSADSLFVDVEVGRHVIGVIGLERCVIRRCDLRGIGIIGTKDDIAQHRTGFREVG